jgi:hypothetical protein
MEVRVVFRWQFLFCVSLLFLWIGCSPAVRSRKSFDEICGKVEGKTATEVETLLGVPNYRQENSLGDERWLWWNYAVLDGESYPPEVRGQIVHLEITFSDPLRAMGRSLPHSQWRVRQPFGVSYLIPRKKA